MKFYRYKQFQRMTFFGYDDLLIDSPFSFSKTSPQSILANVNNDTKVLRFNINRLSHIQLSQNAKIVIEQIYLPLLTLPEGRSGPITVRMNNLNTNSHDSQNNGFSSTLLYTMDQPEDQHALTFQNNYPEMLYNFSIPQNFFQNGFVEFQITYPNIDVVQDSLNRFYSKGIISNKLYYIYYKYI